MSVQIEHSDSFPFRRRLDFTPVLRHWEKQRDGTSAVAARFAREVLSEVELHPFLKEPMDDLRLLDDIPDLVSLLLSPAMPYSASSDWMIAVAAPISMRMVSMTPSFRKALDGLKSDPFLDSGADKPHLLIGWNIILHQLYGVSKERQLPMSLSLHLNGQLRHFQIEIDPAWIDIHVLGDLPPLTGEEIVRLRSNPEDIELYRSLLPPELFEFRGFIVLQAIDITAQRQLSELKQAVLERNALLDTERFERIQSLLRAYLGKPGLGVGIAAVRGDEVLYLNHAAMCNYGCIYSSSKRMPVKDFQGTLFETALRQNQPFWISDLSGTQVPSALEHEMLDNGVSSFLMIPLPGPGGTIGVLILKSPDVADLGPLQVEMLSELVPLFGNSVERSLDEFEDQVQILIQERFTAIHPSVAWRFRDEAARLIESERTGGSAAPEPVIFPEVYPLYSVTDIRSSSSHRNRAIQEDLLIHLRLARDVFRAAYQAESLPVYDEINYRLERYHEALKQDMSTGDEIQIIGFLREVVETSFDQLERYGREVEKRVAKYRKAIDPLAGTVYRKRKDFDESVAEINRVVSDYLEETDAEAQKMFPHYFDKQATDGVDQNVYIGASIGGKRTFSPMHLRNMRLWQFIVLCNVARRMEALKPMLPEPLDTTHLIMVQDMPITIRFDIDEKKFRVDGAYNIRYEIMKKRIDKAVIRETGERLTQPGKIAIVYSHAREATDYREFIEYLGSRGFLEGDTEDLELEDLQGIKGLRALRISVKMDAAAGNAGENIRELAETAFS
jgi:hypothetical protein